MAGNSGLTYATATGTVQAGTGISLDATRFVLGGNLTITNTIGYPFTPGTNFGTTTSATSTSLHTAGVFFASSTTQASQLPYASTTAITVSGTASTTNLNISGISGALLKTVNGVVTAAVAGTDYLTTATTFSYPFPNNATTTTLTFSGGFLSGTSTLGTLTATSSATIGTLSGFIGGNNGLLYAFATSSIRTSQLTNDAGFTTFTYPFPNAATSTLLTFSGGLITSNATATTMFANELLANSARFGQTGSTTISSTGALTTPSLTVGSLSGVLAGNSGLTYATATGTVQAGTGISLDATRFVLGGNLTITNTIGYPFTPGTNFGTTTSATSTSLHTAGVFFASSTTQASQLPYASTTAITVSGTASTTNLNISGISGALLKTVNGVVTAAVAGTDYVTGTQLSNANPFTTVVHFGTTTSATTTSIRTAGVFFASSTVAASQFPYASSTAISVSGRASTTDLTISSVLSSLLKTDATGAVIAAVAGTDYVTGAGLANTNPFTTVVHFGTTTSATTTSIRTAGVFFASSTVAASQFPYASTTMISASLASTTALNISGISNALLKTVNGVVTAAVAGTDYANFAFPFTGTTNFGAVANSTSTPIWFQAGLQASSTARFNSGIAYNGFAVGATTTSPLGLLAVHAPAGSATTTLFVIGSSTAAGAHSTLFSVSNTGSTTIGNFGSCTGANAVTTNSSGTLVCGTVTAAGDGVGNWFTGTTNFGAVANSTSTPIWFQNGLQASSTAQLMDINTVGLLNFATTTPTATTTLVRLGGATFISASSSVSNTGIGMHALANITSGTSNSVVGHQALLTNTTGSSNSALGSNALSANVTGSSNVAIGTNALFQATGSRNTGVGTFSFLSTTGGVDNVALGYQAGRTVTSGYANILIGSHVSTASVITTGAGNVGLGNELYFPSATANNQLNIGGILFGTLPATSTQFRLPATGAIGIASSSPWATLAVHAVDGSTNTTLFAIGSSTASATSTLFSISNTGVITTALSDGCVEVASGVLTSTGSNCGSGAGGGADFTYNQTNFGTTTSATSTSIHTGGVFFASSTTQASQLPYASTTAITVSGTASTTNLNISGISSALLKTVNGVVTAAVAGTDYANFAFPFTGTTNFGAVANSTSTPIWFQAGLQASSTARFNAAIAYNGLTVGATTTSPLGLLTVHAPHGSPTSTLLMVSSSTAAGHATLFSVDSAGTTTINTLRFGDTANNGLFWKMREDLNNNLVVEYPGLARHILLNPGAAATDGFVGIGTTTPFAQLSVNPNGISGASFAIGSSTKTDFVVTNGGRVGLGTTSPSALFSINPTNGGPNLIIAVGSSTGALFSIDNAGTTTMVTATTSRFYGAGLATCQTENVLTWANGFFGCEADTAGAGSGGADFTYGQTNFGQTVSATSTALWLQAGFQASSTAHLNAAVAYNGFGVATSSLFSLFSIHAAAGSATTTLFTIGSTTAAGINSTLFSINNRGIFSYGINSTTTIANNTAFAWTISTTTTGNGSSTLFRIDTTSGAERVVIGIPNSDIIIGESGATANLVFEENATIKGQGAGRILTFGANSDTLKFGISSLVSCSGTFALQTDVSGNIACGAVAGGLGSSGGGGFVATGGSVNGVISQATSTYRVGLGATSTPYAQLSVMSASTATTTFALRPANSQTANIIDIYNTSGVLSSVITAGGHMGLGTASPENALGWGQVLNVHGAANAKMILTNTSQNGGMFLHTGFSFWGNSTGGLMVGTQSNDNLHFMTNTVTRMSIANTGNVGVASTSPYAAFGIHANNGSTNTTLFAIGSSTASATTTLFSISNTGSTTIGNFGACSGSSALNTNSNGTIICGAVSAGSAGGADFEYGLSYFGTTTSATTTALWLRGGVFASSTSRIASTTFTISGNVGIGSTTPLAKLSIHANQGETNRLLFAIGSSTGSTDTNLLSFTREGQLYIATTTKSAFVLNIQGAVGTSTNAGKGVFILTGVGGSVLSSSAGAGGDIRLLTGAGGDVINANGGNGGAISLTTGVGGVGFDTPGVGGNMTLTTGDGGICVGGGCSGSAGGRLTLQTGAGGGGSTGANGGDIVISAGNGANGSEFNDGTGGSVYITGGLGGSGVGNGVNGNIIIGRSLTGNVFNSVGIGTSSPFAAISIQKGYGTPGSVVFAVASSTNDSGSTAQTFFSIDGLGTTTILTATTTRFFGSSLASCNGASQALTWASGLFGCNTISATGGGGADFDYGISYFGTTTSATTTALWARGGIFASSTSYIASTTFAITGNVGLSSTTPWGRLSVDTSSLVNGSPSFVVGSSSRTDLLVAQSGAVGIGTTSPQARFSVEMGTIFPHSFIVSNEGSSTPAFVVSNTNNNGRIGIGTSTPFAQLAVVTNHQNGSPAFIVATTSTWNNKGQAPLIFVTSTTTGDLDYARVSIGTSTGRDSLFVSGRINSSWNSDSCDFLSIAASVAIDTTNACGNFNFDEGNGADGALNIASTSSFVNGKAYYTLESGNASITAGDSNAVRTVQVLAATSSPVMEAQVYRYNPGTTDGNGRSFVVGFFNTAIGGNYGAPSVGAYFIATTSPQNGGSLTWWAVTRDGTGTTTTNTGIATSSPAKLRIELTTSRAIFLANGVVVAQHTSRLPTTTALLSAGIASTIMNTGGGIASLRFSYIRVWSDDPPDGGGASFSMNEVVAPLPSRWNEVDLSVAHYANKTGQFIQGLLVSHATTSGLEMIRLSQSRYDNEITGVVSTAHRLILGEEASSTVRVATLGRAPVIVSTENGLIKKGDRISASAVTGVGMRSSRPGTVVGTVVDPFPTNLSADGIDVPMCDDELKQRLVTSGFEVPEDTCLNTVLVSLNIGSDASTGNIFQDISEPFVDLASALGELANAAYTKGAEFTKLVVGQFVAQLAVIGDLFAQTITTADLTVGSSDQPAGITLFDQQTRMPYCVVMQGGQLVSLEGECSAVGTSTPQITPPPEDVATPPGEDTPPGDQIPNGEGGDTGTSTPPVEEEPPADEPGGGGDTPPAGDPPVEVGGGETPPAETPPTEEPNPEPEAEPEPAPEVVVGDGEEPTI